MNQRRTRSHRLLQHQAGRVKRVLLRLADILRGHHRIERRDRQAVCRHRAAGVDTVHHEPGASHHVHPFVTAHQHAPDRRGVARAWTDTEHMAGQIGGMVQAGGLLQLGRRRIQIARQLCQGRATNVGAAQAAGRSRSPGRTDRGAGRSVPAHRRNRNGGPGRPAQNRSSTASRNNTKSAGNRMRSVPLARSDVSTSA